MHIGIVVNGKADLFEMISALGPASRFTGRLNGRQEQSQQHRDDGNHDEQFDQCESAAMCHGESLVLPGKVTMNRVPVFRELSTLILPP